MHKLNHCSDLEALRQKLQEDRKCIQSTIIIPNGTCCQASNSPAVINAIRKELARQGIDKNVKVHLTGCHGFCEQEPIILFEPGNIIYCHVTPEDAKEIVARTVKNGEIIERLLYTDPVSGKKFRTEAEIPFYQVQDRQLLAYNKWVDPCSIEDYIAIGGYNALLFSAHPDVSEHMEWEQSLSRRFPGCIGHVDIAYLSPRTKILIDQQKVSLGIIEDRLSRIRGRKLKKTII